MDEGQFSREAWVDSWYISVYASVYASLKAYASDPSSYPASIPEAKVMDRGGGIWCQGAGSVREWEASISCHLLAALMESLLSPVSKPTLSRRRLTVCSFLFPLSPARSIHISLPLPLPLPLSFSLSPLRRILVLSSTGRPGHLCNRLINLPHRFPV
ncbi:unnamed protein product [Protopolystoma xenopodis]|uniref:Uncharacterized protein n=1 Tax=Protopolystoma xenopodis TaxID=117903 RepID=A0A448WHD1_9PLAT|nr:unnamed protein product [Protopolystoma xenopodis]